MLLMLLYWMLVGLLGFFVLLFIIGLVKAYDTQEAEKKYYTDIPYETDKEMDEMLKNYPMHRLTRREYKQMPKMHEVPRGYRWMR